jgi:hypothetical protein
MNKIIINYCISCWIRDILQNDTRSIQYQIYFPIPVSLYCEQNLIYQEMLQIQNLERFLVQNKWPQQTYDWRTNATRLHDSFQRDIPGLRQRHTYTIAVKNKGEGEEHTCFKIGWTVENRVDIMTTHMNVMKIKRMDQHSRSF